MDDRVAMEARKEDLVVATEVVLVETDLAI